MATIELWMNKLSKKQQVFLVIALLSIVFIQALTAGESMGSAIYYLTH